MQAFTNKSPFKSPPKYFPIHSEPPDTCRFCGERNETFIHLTECPRLRDYQVESFLGENRAWEWSHEQILKFAKCRAVNDAIEDYEFGEYSFMSSIVSESSDDSTSPFRYSQPEPD